MQYLRRFVTSHPGNIVTKDAASLVDTRVLDAFSRIAGRTRAHELVRDGIEAYDRSCVDMHSTQGRVEHLELVGAHAHALKGSAGTLGLRGIASVAVRIEAAATAGADTFDLLRELRSVLDATRFELVELGVLSSQ
jgi:HPt (histidine-containing phosphotransfer) domain-containing protein